MVLPWLAATILLAAILGAFLGGRLAKEAQEDFLRDLEELELPEAQAQIADVEQRADVAYTRLFGDGLGLQGGQAMAWKEFQQRYMAAALQEQASNSSKGNRNVPVLPGTLAVEEFRKKDAPETLDGQVEALLAQKLQYLAVKKVVKEGKARHTLVPGTVPCAAPLYEQVYSPVDGCSASNAALTNSPPCGRWEQEDLANKDEVAAVRANMLEAFQQLFHEGPKTSLALDSNAWSLISRTLVQDLLERSRQTVSNALGGIQIFFSGALLVRLQIPSIEGEMQKNSSKGDEFSAHVDKANVASYDWSALLYLSTGGRDFEGGELMFLDDDLDSEVAPKDGRLVFFSSGLENVHRVSPMVSGRRLVLAMWFTCSRRHAHPDLNLSHERKTDKS